MTLYDYRPRLVYVVPKGGRGARARARAILSPDKQAYFLNSRAYRLLYLDEGGIDKNRLVNISHTHFTVLYRTENSAKYCSLRVFDIFSSSTAAHSVIEGKKFGYVFGLSNTRSNIIWTSHFGNWFKSSTENDRKLENHNLTKYSGPIPEKCYVKLKTSNIRENIVSILYMINLVEDKIYITYGPSINMEMT